MATTTVTGLYDTYDAAVRSVRDLEAANIPHADISIVAYRNGTGEASTNAATGAEAGASAGAVAGGGVGLLAGLGVLAIPGVGPVVAAGWLVATAVGVVAGAAAGGATGGLIGSLTSAGVSTDHANFYAEGIRRGGALVTARVNQALVETTENIMRQHGRIDPAAREKAYRDSGWRQFNEKSIPFTPAQVAHERALYPNQPTI